MDPQKDVAELTKEKERPELRSHIIDTARIVCGAGSETVERPSVRPSVPSIDSSRGVRRVCWSSAVRTGDIDR